MKNVDQWGTIAEMLGNLIAKYADVLDIDSMSGTDVNSNITNREVKEKIFNESIEECKNI